MAKLGETFPNFSLKTTFGDINLYDWFGDNWGILFSHPAAFTPVCTTELARVVELFSKFTNRNCKLIALSCDSNVNNLKWQKDIAKLAGWRDPNFPYPIIADENRDIAVALDMIDPDEKTKDGFPLTARAVFIIDPKKKMRLSILYPATIGRNFDEILRVLDALQLVDNHNGRIATPVDWKVGDEVVIVPTVPEKEINENFKLVKSVELPSKQSYFKTSKL